MYRKNWTPEKIFERLLTNKSDKTFDQNVRELRRRGTPEIFDKCVDLCHSDQLDNRLLGTSLLSQYGKSPHPQVIALFLEMLKIETEPSVISTILFAFGHNNEDLTEKEIKFLCTFQKHPRAIVRHGLSFALGGVRSKTAIDTLILLTKDKNRSIRDWSTFNIGSLSKQNTSQIRTALWERINDKYLIIRLEAIRGLAYRKEVAVKEYIKKELIYVDFCTSNLLFEAITALKDKELIPVLEELQVRNEVEKIVNAAFLQETIDGLKGKRKE
jgi:HEAT repeat protein